MKQKLIDGASYSRICENCINGRLSADGKSILCVRNGIMDLQSTCKKYKYDPLKRRPKRPNTVKEFTKEDFSL